MGMGIQAGRMSRNVAYDSQLGFQVTNNRGMAANGNRYLSEGKKDALVAKGDQMSRYTAHDAADKAHAHQASGAYNAAYKQAWSDGHITKAEQRDLNGLRRDKNQAWAQVNTDSARRNYGRTLEHAAQNGRITPSERQKLGEARSNLEGMRSTVNSMQSRDARLDARDNAVRNSAQGFFENFQSANLQQHAYGKVF